MECYLQNTESPEVLCTFSLIKKLSGNSFSSPILEILIEFQLIVLYSVKILIKCEGRIKIFSGMQRVTEEKSHAAFIAEVSENVFYQK